MQWSGVRPAWRAGQRQSNRLVVLQLRPWLSCLTGNGGRGDLRGEGVLLAPSAASAMPLDRRRDIVFVKPGASRGKDRRSRRMGGDDRRARRGGGLRADRFWRWGSRSLVGIPWNGDRSQGRVCWWKPRWTPCSREMSQGSQFFHNLMGPVRCTSRCRWASARWGIGRGWSGGGGAEIGACAALVRAGRPFPSCRGESGEE